MKSVDLRGLFPVDHLGFAYTSSHSIPDIESENYFLPARDHLRRGDRLYVASLTVEENIEPQFMDYAVVDSGSRSLRIKRLNELRPKTRNRTVQRTAKK